MTLDLDKLETLAKAATPGPWDIKANPELILHHNFRYCVAQKHSLANHQWPHDAEYIAALPPEVVLELVAEVKRLREAETFYESNSASAVVQNRSLHTENKKLREALEFYADKTNYNIECAPIYKETKNNEMDWAELDHGQLARTALGEVK